MSSSTEEITKTAKNEPSEEYTSEPESESQIEFKPANKKQSRP